MNFVVLPNVLLLLILFVLDLCNTLTPTELSRMYRVGAPVLNPSKTLAAYEVTKHEQETPSLTTNITIMDINNETISVIAKKDSRHVYSDPQWLDNNTVVFLLDSNLHYANVHDGIPHCFNLGFQIRDYKSHPQSQSLAFWSELETRRGTTMGSGVIYDQLMIRHWDTYLNPNRKTQLFYLQYSMDSTKAPVANATIPRNLLLGTGLEYDESSTVDFSPDGSQIAFSSKVPGKDVAWSTNMDIFVASTLERGGPPVSVSSSNFGADTNPIFSPDGKLLAWLQMETPQYEADLNRIVILNLETKEFKSITKSLDRSPESIHFSPDGLFIYTHLEDLGELKIYRMAIFDKVRVLEELIGYNHNNGIQIIDEDNILFKQESSVQPAELYKLSIGTKTITQLTQYNVMEPNLSRPESFWFKGANNDMVHGWNFKPIDFDSSKRYPVAFLIHGGPQSSWNSDFSYRWNPQIYTSAGFGVVAINFHGSTGYGDEFTRSILNQWGGHPFEDLMLGLDSALSMFPYLDGDRVAALGASYGGYMTNWINSQTDRFKCLVTHDGIFDMVASYYNTDELWSTEFDFAGPAFKQSDLYKKWSPLTHVTNMKTPNLIVHSELDYRCSLTDGIGAFTALQRMGVPSKFMHFKDENHWILKPANTVQWLEEILSWIRKWTSESPDDEVKMWNEYKQGLANVHQEL